MPLAPGTALGSYSVTAKIGEGGMGEVYRARDTKLDQDVALKVLPQAFTDDPDRLARFEREAKVLASLNHPNIGHIYGLEEAEGQKALVLELVEGPTLAERIKQGPIPVDEALPIARQIAEALEAAHEQGIIHRDLKPANIKVRDDGTVKVLDFGLAKALEGDGSNPSESPTITAAATQQGVILGTAAYMSPEQARGRPVDRRADIWAFGAVLYEMLTGRRPFEGRDVSEVLAAVIQSTPDWEALPSGTPPHLHALLKRCMEKEPRQRVQAIGDVRLAMEGAFASAGGELSSSDVAGQLPVWQRPIAGLIAGLVIASLAALGIWTTRSPSASVPQPPVRSTINIPATEQLVLAGQVTLALSPDGRAVVYIARSNRDGITRLYQRQIDELDAVPVPGTENVRSFCFSPDGEWVVFTGENVLRKVRLRGGAAETICDACSGAHPAWISDDTIIFPGDSGLVQVSAAGGEPRPFLDLEDGETAHRYPESLPGGQAILFTVRGRSADGEVVVHSLETGERQVLVVQIRQVCPVGVSPTGVRARSPVAWIAARRETN